MWFSLILIRYSTSDTITLECTSDTGQDLSGLVILGENTVTSINNFLAKLSTTLNTFKNALQLGQTAQREESENKAKSVSGEILKLLESIVVVGRNAAQGQTTKGITAQTQGENDICLTRFPGKTELPQAGPAGPQQIGLQQAGPAGPQQVREERKRYRRYGCSMDF
jgi:hypothetical protein